MTAALRSATINLLSEKAIERCPEAQCIAARELVRPYEVARLVHLRPARGARLAFADTVALWLRGQLASGGLRYIADPPNGDLWCSPSVTLARGGGDCDDFAILATSLLLHGADASLVVGEVFQDWQWQGHAWVQGNDERGGFLLEATSGEIMRKRSLRYRPKLIVRDFACQYAA